MVSTRKFTKKTDNVVTVEETEVKTYPLNVTTLLAKKRDLLAEIQLINDSLLETKKAGCVVNDDDIVIVEEPEAPEEA
tara:strand:+ start:146 stop:379 length:234 start_codon:yes stop_codon:yes gene_type:complete